MSAYDPDKVEVWVVGGMGFWREGEVNLTEHMIRVECTWMQVKAVCDQFSSLYRKHAGEKRDLEDLQADELTNFRLNPLKWVAPS